MSQETKKYTFKTFCDAYEKIEIPILQRDYAQGRAEKKHLRNAFVDYLADKLATQYPIELDFVYGVLEGGSFIPLDGQQRLTTLWLLHWFLAVKDNALNQDVKNLLSRFKYETRPAALSFCEKLLKETIPAEKLPEIKEYITDQSWFEEHWVENATVSGMLTMLQTFAENEKLKEVSFDTLWSGELISFYFLDIENFGLSNELYIRMNARGEELTDYEHFKSEFYKTIQKHPKIDHSKIEDVKIKMDKNWVEILWKFRKEGVFVTDEIFMNYLSFINEMQFSAEYKEGQEREKVDYKSISFNSNFYKNDEKTDFLIFTFDAIPVLEKIEYPNILKEKSFKDILNTLLKDGKADTDEKVIVYSALLYIRKHQLKEPNANLLEFIRVIRNLIVNTSDKGVRELGRILPSIEKMATEVSVYNCLINNEKEIIGFRSSQVEEEVWKANLYKEKQDAKAILLPIEDHENFLGNLVNLIAVAFGVVENDFSFDNHKVSDLNLIELENIYKTYLKIYQDSSNFENIWGDLLISSMYDLTDNNNKERIVWQKENYQKHRSILDFAKQFSESNQDLTDFIVQYEKKKVKEILNKYQDYRQVKDKKEQLFLLYVITTQIMNKKNYDDFFRNGANFGCLDKEVDYSSIFIDDTENEFIFQTYESHFRYNSGLNKDKALPPQCEEKEKQEELFNKLIEWINV